MLFFLIIHINPEKCSLFTNKYLCFFLFSEMQGTLKTHDCRVRTQTSWVFLKVSEFQWTWRNKRIALKIMAKPRKIHNAFQFTELLFCLINLIQKKNLWPHNYYNDFWHAQASKYSLENIGAKFCQVKTGRTITACLQQGARFLLFETSIPR